MRLNTPLLRLPLRFDADRLAAEVAALPDHAWLPHPNRLPGNEAVLLVTTRGTMTDDIANPMAPTEFLLASPYMMETMAAIGAVWGRSRLMRLAPGAAVPRHVDTNFYWRTHVRIHVPIITTPQVLFSCAGTTVHMAAGECWIFDTFSNHQVRNAGPVARTHLVLDTIGGPELLDLIADAHAPGAPPAPALPAAPTARFIAPGSIDAKPLAFEQTLATGPMTPWELRYHIAFIADRSVPDPRLSAVMARLERFAEGWAACWAQYGADTGFTNSYRALMTSLNADLHAIPGGQTLRLRNELPVYRQIAELLFTADASLSAKSAVLPEHIARFGRKDEDMVA